MGSAQKRTRDKNDEQASADHDVDARFLIGDHATSSRTSPPKKMTGIMCSTFRDGLRLQRAVSALMQISY
jgi:hypothetical protein